MKQVILVLICATIAAICFGSSEIPKECVYGSHDYNDALCNDTCTKSEHADQSYCANYTHVVTTKAPVSPTPAHEDHSEKEEVKKEESKPKEHNHQEHDHVPVKGFAPSIQPSILFATSSFLLSFCL